MRTIIALILLAVPTGVYADIRLEGPTDRVEAGQLVDVKVVGLTLEELKAAQATCDPVPSYFQAVYTWEGDVRLMFQAMEPGTYFVEVGINRWQTTWRQGVVEVQNALKDDANAAASLRTLDALEQYYSANYPQQYASIEIEVGDPPPPPPPPVPEKAVCVIVEETSQRTAQQGIIMASQELRGLFPGYFYVLDKDVETVNGMTPDVLKAFVDRAGDKPLPVLLITDRGSGKVYHCDTLPGTLEETLEVARQYSKAKPDKVEAVRKFRKVCDQDGCRWEPVFGGKL